MVLLSTLLSVFSYTLQTNAAFEAYLVITRTKCYLYFVFEKFYSFALSSVYLKVLIKLKTDLKWLTERVWVSTQPVFRCQFSSSLTATVFCIQDSKAYQKRAKAVVNSLEEVVDPFDLDVFSPFIQQHLSKQAQRSAVSGEGLFFSDKNVFVRDAGGHL